MFCKKFQTFSTQNSNTKLPLPQQLTNLVKNFFSTFSTEAPTHFRNTPCAQAAAATKLRASRYPTAALRAGGPPVHEATGGHGFVAALPAALHLIYEL